MPENNEPQYELDKDYAPLGIVDAADGSGTTWPEFVEHVNKMDNQVAALTEEWDSQNQTTIETIPDSGNEYWLFTDIRIKKRPGWAELTGVLEYKYSAPNGYHDIISSSPLIPAPAASKSYVYESTIAGTLAIIGGKVRVASNGVAVGTTANVHVAYMTD